MKRPIKRWLGVSRILVAIQNYNFYLKQQLHHAIINILEQLINNVNLIYKS